MIQTLPRIGSILAVVLLLLLTGCHSPPSNTEIAGLVTALATATAAILAALFTGLSARAAARSAQASEKSTKNTTLINVTAERYSKESFESRIALRKHLDTHDGDVQKMMGDFENRRKKALRSPIDEHRRRFTTYFLRLFDLRLHEFLADEEMLRFVNSAHTSSIWAKSSLALSICYWESLLG